MDNLEKPIFDKAYCDANGIQAEWFKFDKGLARFLVALCEDEKGNFIEEDSSVLGLTSYAICKKLLCGEIDEVINSILNRKGMKLSKLAYSTAEESIELARSRVAENRYNGALGKPPKNRQ